MANILIKGNLSWLNINRIRYPSMRPVCDQLQYLLTSLLPLTQPLLLFFLLPCFPSLPPLYQMSRSQCDHWPVWSLTSAVALLWCLIRAAMTPVFCVQCSVRTFQSWFQCPVSKIQWPVSNIQCPACSVQPSCSGLPVPFCPAVGLHRSSVTLLYMTPAAAVMCSQAQTVYSVVQYITVQWSVV